MDLSHACYTRKKTLSQIPYLLRLTRKNRMIRPIPALEFLRLSRSGVIVVETVTRLERLQAEVRLDRAEYSNTTFTLLKLIAINAILQEA